MALIDPTTQTQSFALREAVQAREGRANRVLEAQSLAARLQAETAANQQAAELAQQRLSQELQIANADRMAQEKLQKERLDAEAAENARKNEALAKQSEADRRLQASIAQSTLQAQRNELDLRRAAVLNPENSDLLTQLEEAENAFDANASDIGLLTPRLAGQQEKLNKFFGERGEEARQRLNFMLEQEADLVDRISRSASSGYRESEVLKGAKDRVDIAQNSAMQLRNVIESATGTTLSDRAVNAMRILAQASVEPDRVDGEALSAAIQTLQTDIDPVTGAALRKALTSEVVNGLSKSQDARNSVNRILLAFRARSPNAIMLESLDKATANGGINFTGILDPGARLFRSIDSQDITSVDEAMQQFESIKKESLFLQGLDDETAREMFTLAVEEADTESQLTAAKNLSQKLLSQRDSLQRRFRRQEESRETKQLLDAYDAAAAALDQLIQNIGDVATETNQ